MPEKKPSLRPMKVPAKNFPTPIEVHGLNKSFGSLKAVQGLDLQVRHGECFGLLGRNGAGKSTTIKMLISLLPPDSGSAKVNGFDLHTQGVDVRATIGYVAQSLSVDGGLTGRENLEVFGMLYNLPRALRRQRIAELLKVLNLEDAADRVVATYSGGMIRRLEIGQSILHRPPLVFLDEPTVGLDPVARRTLWEHIQSLQRKEGLSLLLTTHAMDEAEFLCDRLAIMDKGRVVASGTLDDLRRQAKRPRASLDNLFTHFTGGEAPEPKEEKGSLRDVQRSRRTASRLG
jgi:ABC-2 type transport system ATP-binding protein